jgi:predicted lipoprotein with Yx(FWY)xxD motif
LVTRTERREKVIPTRKARVYPILLLALTLLLAACGGETATVPTSEPAAPTAGAGPEEAVVVPNAVTVQDQALGADNTVTIESVTSAAAGWLVVHAQADGGPGPVLGFAPVGAGENSDVVVEIDPAGATEILYAMLHVDAGNAGEYEFPGPDVPATDAGGNVVTPSFALTGGAASGSMLLLAESDELGPYLTDSAGMTVYLFTMDQDNLSTCYDDCAAAWPPLLVQQGEMPVAGDGVDGAKVGLTERDDGAFQVTYDGAPLYFWNGDRQPGDTTGQGVGDVWFVVAP